MTLEHLYQEIVAQRQKFDEVREDIAEVSARLSVLETKFESQKSGLSEVLKLFGWLITVGISVAALVVACN